MSQVVTNLGTGGAALNARLGSGTGADSNDPLFLDWSGENYVYLTGVVGNYLSVPDSAALDITGDIDIRVKVALDDWTSAASLLSKFTTSSLGRSYVLTNLSTGKLRFSWSTDGDATGQTNTESTVATGIANGSAKWVRATLDADNGAGGYDVKFYLSDDGVSWSQLGATVTGGSTTSIYSSTTEVRIGALATFDMAVKKSYRAQVFDGIDGTKVLDIDTSVVSGDSTSFTALTGQTVTINRSTSGRKAVAVTHPVWLFGTNDYMEVADNDLLDFGASDSFTVLGVVRQWTTPVNGGYIVGKKDGISPFTGWALYALNTNAATGVLHDGTTQVTAASGTATIGSVAVFSSVVDRAAQNITSGIGSTQGTPSSISAVGSVENSIALGVGRRNSGAANYNDMEFIAAAVFRRALTAGEIAAITTYYQNRVA